MAVLRLVWRRRIAAAAAGSAAESAGISARRPTHATTHSCLHIDLRRLTPRRRTTVCSVYAASYYDRRYKAS